MTAPLLQLERVCHDYDTESRRAIRAVDGVSFDIHEGETFGLVGESGCGKTTTGRMIVKLLPVTSGTIRFDGRDVAGLTSRNDLMRFRREAQIVFQDPYASLDPRKKVRDIVAEGLDAHRLTASRDEREGLVAEQLRSVGLNPDFMTRYPHEFSGGQRQRIGIARALAVGPRFVVCDEPISALDVSIQAQIVNLLKDLQVEKRLTMLFIAHDLSMVRYVSDRIGVMYRGRLVEIGPAEAVYHDPIHPYTKSLLSAIPLPEPMVERLRRRVPYRQDDGAGVCAMRQARPGRFVYCDDAGRFG
ncbi:MAG: ATP-binding cassette domain-containing protein [Oscillospiraceae bacterium]|jgi:oligopeptide transport system ATP-binding protein|nr:ATP-binding cassette domain-containing protein [Oscillospiraceae bacterium]